MNKPLLSGLLLVLALLGLADSWYIAQSELSHTALTCNLGAMLDGCNVVAQSQYSHLFGIPIAVYGAGFYATLFVLGALILVFPARILYRALVLIGVFGALASLLFVFIQFVLIKAICIYCIGSAVIAIVIWTITYRLWKRYAPPRLPVIIL